MPITSGHEGACVSLCVTVVIDPGLLYGCGCLKLNSKRFLFNHNPLLFEKEKIWPNAPLFCTDPYFLLLHAGLSQVK